MHRSSVFHGQSEFSLPYIGRPDYMFVQSDTVQWRPHHLIVRVPQVYLQSSPPAAQHQLLVGAFHVQVLEPPTGQQRFAPADDNFQHYAIISDSFLTASVLIPAADDRIARPHGFIERLCAYQQAVYFYLLVGIHFFADWCPVTTLIRRPEALQVLKFPSTKPCLPPCALQDP